MGFRCATCNEEHEGLPQMGFEFPDPYFNVPEDERGERVEASTDMCRVDEDYFIRGVIEIHVHDFDEPFGFGVWVSQKKENFETYLDDFDSAEIGPFFGWLSNTLTCYEEDTFALKTMAHFRGKGLRPSIEVEPTDHPLALDQQNGITLSRAWELMHHYIS